MSTPFPRCFNLRQIHELPSLTPLRFRFLLHYIARDEVALHERGTGGVPEIRNAIEGYEECSPLYGFLQYRRRKVIIRYMPEGLSRLILGMPNRGMVFYFPHRNWSNLFQPEAMSNSSPSPTSSPQTTLYCLYPKPPISPKAPCPLPVSSIPLRPQLPLLRALFAVVG